MNDEKLERFLKRVEKEWNWRQRELTFFKQALASVDMYQKEAMSRAGILLLYSHWEGFIKKISKDFLVCFANEDVRQAPRYVIAAHLAKMHDNLSAIYNKINVACKCLDYISDGAKICVSIHEIINTESNLNSKILKKIADSVGVNFSEFETRLQFIDRSFISERHAIAHGDGRRLTEDEFLELEKNVTLLMDTFKKNIIDSAEYANNFLNSGTQHICLKIIN
jgi:hypothetical protein